LLLLFHCTDLGIAVKLKVLLLGTQGHRAHGRAATVGRRYEGTKDVGR
jgi:hypothetical protein